MSKIVVVGTLAFDTIETPYGKVDRVIGGSAPFASLAAKTKDIQCAIISIVGNDFPKSYLDILSSNLILQYFNRFLTSPSKSETNFS